MKNAALKDYNARLLVQEDLFKTYDMKIPISFWKYIREADEVSFNIDKDKINDVINNVKGFCQLSNAVARNALTTIIGRTQKLDDELSSFDDLSIQNVERSL